MSKSKTQSNIDWKQWHGCLGDKNWPIPKCVTNSHIINRKDQGSKITSSEYLDEVDVLDKKMEIVAKMMKKSNFCVAYTGAGLSRSAGIGDYASKAKDSIMNKYKKLKSNLDAEPTYSHYALVNFYKNGLLHYIVNQNHDCLAEKAGMPQNCCNEIHGSWYDVSNPVVQFSGTLRGDLFGAMLEAELLSDFCICLGTSLSGMNSDRMIKTACRKFAAKENGHNGAVIVNLQFTSLDKKGVVPIRVWAKIDDAMKVLAKHLGIKVDKTQIKTEKDIIECPYDKKGAFDETKKMVLDLSIGSKIKIIQPGASNKGLEGVVYKKDKFGHYVIHFPKKKYSRMMGKWWMTEFANGNLMQIPIINVNPKFKKKKND